MQPKMIFKRIEISIAMQERVSLLYAYGRNQAIDRLSHRVAAFSKKSVAIRRSHRQRTSARINHHELQQIVPQSSIRSIPTNTLKHLAQDEVGQRNPLRSQGAIEPFRMRVRCRPEVIHPH